jgi:hypothetical protein
MLQAVETGRGADFYAALNDDEKARFTFCRESLEPAPLSPAGREIGLRKVYIAA